MATLGTQLATAKALGAESGERPIHAGELAERLGTEPDKMAEALIERLQGGTVVYGELGAFEPLGAILAKANRVDAIRILATADGPAPRPTHGKLLAWAHAATGNLEQWREEIAERVRSAADADRRAGWLLAGIYAAQVPPEQSPGRAIREARKVLGLSDDQAARFGAVAWLVRRRAADGATVKAASILGSVAHQFDHAERLDLEIRFGTCTFWRDARGTSGVLRCPIGGG